VDNQQPLPTAPTTRLTTLGRYEATSPAQLPPRPGYAGSPG